MYMLAILIESRGDDLENQAESILARLERGERPRVHPVDVERPVEMIDLVLQDPGRPARDAPAVRCSVGGQPGHLDFGETRHLRAVPRHAQAALAEGVLLLAQKP